MADLGDFDLVFKRTDSNQRLRDLTAQKSKHMSSKTTIRQYVRKNWPQVYQFAVFFLLGVDSLWAF